ncbi:MAG: MBL fold metallo-hydrolase [Patescibacteria group bacterium]
MEIFWHGNSSVTIKTKNATLGFNPKKNDDYDLLVFGTKQEKLKLKEYQFVIDSPGEYEAKSIMVYSVYNEEKQSRGWQVKIEDLTVYFTDNLDFLPTKEQLDNLGTVDLAFFPAVINKDDEKKLQKQVEAIDPRIIIPIAGSDEVEAQVCQDLARVLGLKCNEILKSYKIKSRQQLPEEEQLFVTLEKTA